MPLRPLHLRHPLRPGPLPLPVAAGLRILAQADLLAVHLYPLPDLVEVLLDEGTHLVPPIDHHAVVLAPAGKHPVLHVEAGEPPIVDVAPVDGAHALGDPLGDAAHGLELAHVPAVDRVVDAGAVQLLARLIELQVSLGAGGALEFVVGF